MSAGGGGGGGGGVPFTAARASTRPQPKYWSQPAAPRSLAVPVMTDQASALVKPRDIRSAPTPETCGVAMGETVTGGRLPRRPPSFSGGLFHFPKFFFGNLEPPQGRADDWD